MARIRFKVEFEAELDALFATASVTPSRKALDGSVISYWFADDQESGLFGMLDSIPKSYWTNIAYVGRSPP